MAVVEAIDLHRTYRTSTGTIRRKWKNVEAVRGVSFEIEKGELFGLLGPNGAGKTTTIKMLITLLIPTSGTARVLGHDPPVVFLDEPTIGLDPVGARELRATIAQLVDAGKTVLLTTHYMFEADALCDRIAVINKGEIVAHGTPMDLKRGVAEGTVVEVEVFGLPEGTTDRVRDVPGVLAVSVEEREQAQVLIVQTKPDVELTHAILGTLNGANVGRISRREPTLEDAYVALVSSEE